MPERCRKRFQASRNPRSYRGFLHCGGDGGSPLAPVCPAGSRVLSAVFAGGFRHPAPGSLALDGSHCGALVPTRCRKRAGWRAVKEGCLCPVASWPATRPSSTEARTARRFDDSGNAERRGHAQRSTPALAPGSQAAGEVRAVRDSNPLLRLSRRCDGVSPFRTIRNHHSDHSPVVKRRSHAEALRGPLRYRMTGRASTPGRAT